MFFRFNFHHVIRSLFAFNRPSRLAGSHNEENRVGQDQSRRYDDLEKPTSRSTGLHEFHRLPV
jgi:hypothetical protein